MKVPRMSLRGRSLGRSAGRLALLSVLASALGGAAFAHSESALRFLSIRRREPPLRVESSAVSWRAKLAGATKLA